MESLLNVYDKDNYFIKYLDLQDNINKNSLFKYKDVDNNYINIYRLNNELKDNYFLKIYFDEIKEGYKLKYDMIFYFDLLDGLYMWKFKDNEFLSDYEKYIFVDVKNIKKA